MNTLNLQLLLTGDELMSGDITDTNSVMIANQFSNFGIKVTRRVTVPDNLEALVSEITHISQQADILIINGGLGPTVDDLTAEALAKAMNVPLEQHPDAHAHLVAWCKRRGFELSGPNLKQAILPKGVEVLANDIGSAVGFAIEFNQCKIFCTPGVPPELKHMLKQEILPRLQSDLETIEKSKTLRMQVFGYGEANLQQLISEQFPDWPKDIEVGFRASLPLLELKLTGRGESAINSLPIWKQKIEQVLGSHIIGEDSVKMPEVLINVLKEKGQTVATAESCTGGLIASQITSIAGSSAVFEAGFVTYSNDIKSSVLGVKAETLKEHGAVSQPVVEQMVQGALEKSGSDWAVAVSGIAGPDGGSEEKPVGTVWIAWGNKENIQSIRLVISFSRVPFQIFVSAIAMDLVRRAVLGIEEKPKFLERFSKNRN